MQTNRIDHLSVPSNTILHGDCISIMRSLPASSIDFVLTDPPYLVRYQDREGGPFRTTATPTGWCQHFPKPIAFSGRITS